MAVTSGNVSLEAATTTLVVANTPRFLFSRLLRDSAVQLAAQRHTVPDLMNWLRQRAAERPEAVSDLVEVYVHLVSLALKDPVEVAPELDRLSLPNVPWAEEIASLIAARQPSSRILIEPPAGRLSPRPEEGVPSSHTIVYVPGQARLAAPSEESPTSSSSASTLSASVEP